jgi:predicted anti-sigma-YlaC factor YlaD
MLTCRELTELITEYLEGRMSFWQRVQVQMHLGMCRHCRAYLRQMKATIQMLGKLPAEPIPPDIERELLRRFASLSPKDPEALPGSGPGAPDPRGRPGPA